MTYSYSASKHIIYISTDKNKLKNDLTNCFAIDTTEDRTENFADLQADGSGRSWINGVMDMSIIREDVWSTELKFKDITYDSYVKLLQNLKNKSDGGFYISVFNDEKQIRQIKHCYRGDRQATKHHYRSGWYADLSVKIVQY